MQIDIFFYDQTYPVFVFFWSALIIYKNFIFTDKDWSEWFMLSCWLVLNMASMYTFPTSKFQMARIKLKILTHPSISFLYVFKRLESSQLQNLSLSDPSVNSKWTSFTVYISAYSYCNTVILFSFWSVNLIWNVLFWNCMNLRSIYIRVMEMDRLMHSFYSRQDSGDELTS